jgi:hypothetical protein
MAREITTHTVTLTADQRYRFASYLARRPNADNTTLDYVGSADEITVAPQLVWSPVDHVVFNDHGQYECVIGDANGSVSPRTTMGANLAIQEAAGLLSGNWSEPNAVDEINQVLATSRDMISGLVGHGTHG